MENKDLIHLKFEYNEAIESKRKILNVEKSLMIIAKAMDKYSSLRRDELDKKVKLHRKVRGTLTSIKKLQKTIPKVEAPNKIKKEVEKEIIPKVKKSKYGSDIESQLQDIQEKLNSLQK
tara:strand:- start:258 stop:614 length:357 start_codon:yes stop_codon:yes gene_type:complete